MTDDNVRFHAQLALHALEIIDKQAKGRKPEYNLSLAFAIDEARKHLFKLVGTTAGAAVNAQQYYDEPISGGPLRYNPAGPAWQITATDGKKL